MTSIKTPDEFERLIRAFLKGKLPVGDDSSPSLPLLLKDKQAAKLLAIGTRQLWKLKKEGKIPHIQIGRSVRYSIDDLKTWVDRQKKGGQA